MITTLVISSLTKLTKGLVTNKEIYYYKYHFYSPFLWLVSFQNLEHFDNENKNYNFENSPKTECVIIKIKVNNNYKLLKLQTLNYQFHKAIGTQNNIFRGFINIICPNTLKKNRLKMI